MVSLAIGSGFLAGLLGAYLSRGFWTYSLPGDLDLSSLNANRSNLLIQDPKKVVVNQDDKVAETKAGLR